MILYKRNTNPITKKSSKKSNQYNNKHVIIDNLDHSRRFHLCDIKLTPVEPFHSIAVHQHYLRVQVYKAGEL